MSTLRCGACHRQGCSGSVDGAHAAVDRKVSASRAAIHSPGRRAALSADCRWRVCNRRTFPHDLGDHSIREFEVGQRNGLSCESIRSFSPNDEGGRVALADASHEIDELIVQVHGRKSRNSTLCVPSTRNSHNRCRNLSLCDDTDRPHGRARISDVVWIPLWIFVWF